MSRNGIFHDELSHAPWESPQTARLPGTVPVGEQDWLTVDAQYAEQMAERIRLLTQTRSAVLDMLPEAAPGVAELYEIVLRALEAQPGFLAEDGWMQCPDGRRVPLDPEDPLGTLGQLVQEDLCLMEKPVGGSEHILTAAVLCFPANWTLSEKIGRPLTAIHTPVPQYGDDLARRVQRLFDALRAPEEGGRMLLRMNGLDHHLPALFQTRKEAEARPQGLGTGDFLRVERQCLRRLPRTNAIVFSIHTTVMPMERLTGDQRAAFQAYTSAHNLKGV